MKHWTPPLTGDGRGTHFKAVASDPNGQQRPTVACDSGEALAAVRTLGQIWGWLGWTLGAIWGAIPSIPRGRSL